MAEYRKHPGRPLRLQHDAIAVLDAGDALVWFYLEDEGWEGLRAKRLAPDLARIAAVPVFAYGVALGDEVRVRQSAEGATVATELVRSAGNSTFRVIFPLHGAPEPDERWRTLLTDLGPRGCWLDVYSPQLVAVSADEDAAGEVLDYLAAREERGELAFEAAAGDRPLPQDVR